MLEDLIRKNNNKLDEEFIEHLVQLYNNYVTINLKSFDKKSIIYLDQYSNRFEAFEQLKKNLNCKHLKCVLTKDFIKYSKDKLSDLFMKNMKITSDSYEKKKWLSNLDIDLVMNQFEYIFVNFLYTGTVLIDFDHEKMLQVYKNFFLIDDSNKKIKCFHYQKNFCSNKKYSINSIATVYNTASSKESQGKHWITTFCQKVDKKNIFVYFFDSLGYSIPLEIIQFFDTLKKLFEKYDLSLCIFDNYNIKHQYSNSECGVYAITFIKTLLENSSNLKKAYKLYFKNPEKKISDSEIEKNRKKYFKPQNKRLFHINSDIII